LINRDVAHEVVRRILDHDSPQMTAHYAHLHDTQALPNGYCGLPRQRSCPHANACLT
jgi:hypothetical protein